MMNNTESENDNKSSGTCIDFEGKACNDLCKRVLQPFLIERPDTLGDSDIYLGRELLGRGRHGYYATFLQPVWKNVEIEGGGLAFAINKELKVNYINLLAEIFSEAKSELGPLQLPSEFHHLSHLERLQLSILFILEFSKEYLLDGDPINDTKAKQSIENMISPYWAMIGKVVFMEQVERYNYIRENYQFWVSDDEGKKAKVLAGLKVISTRYKIIRIDTAYHVMFTYWGTNPIFNKAFLVREKYRRAMVTNGGIFWYGYQNPDLTINIEEKDEDGKFPETGLANFNIYDFNDIRDRDDEHDSNALKEILGAFSGLVSILNNPHGYVRVPKPFSTDPDATVVVPQISTLSYWGGCGMKIPIDAGITVGFEKVFPAVYVREEKDDETLIIQEYAWHTNMIVQNPKSVKINGVPLEKIKKEASENLKKQRGCHSESPEDVNDGINGNHNDDIFDKRMASHLGASLSFGGHPSLNVSYEISKQKYNQIADEEFFYTHIKKIMNEINPSEKKSGVVTDKLTYFRKMDVHFLKPLKDCRIVVQLPYVTPQSDALTSVSFGEDKDGEPEDELILSCS